MRLPVFCIPLLLFIAGRSSCEELPREVAGIYPSLAMYNQEGECGTGAVVPWADRLWVITYGPHLPFGSSDKLYEITPDLRQIIRPESVGGTPANRLIHRESQQLIIGPYFIDAERKIRTIAPRLMPGRLTGTARHLSEPATKVYVATMEEGLYEVDVSTLAVTGLIKDGNTARPGETAEELPATIASKLPGYHGKGLYSGRGRLIYANNGEQSSQALVDPTIASGALAEWHGSGDWSLVRRNQFTEVSGPGGILGSDKPETDPVWSIGWDARSLILMLLDGGQWHAYRLPKASHCYDGAHGWNTEWPRIREIGEKDLLMTMHGTFWRFPKGFCAANSSGISPRSTYLKVIGDFCRWNDRLVFGCDDTAKSEFLNKRKLKGALAGPGQSQSNLWFCAPEKLDQLGPAIGRGAVWLNDEVKANTPSDPYLFSGYEHRSLHLAADGAEAMSFTLEIDRRGNGQWTKLHEIEVPSHGATWYEFPAEQKGEWVRLKASCDCPQVTAFFHYRNSDRRSYEAAHVFAGIAQLEDRYFSRGLLHERGADLRSLRFVGYTPDGGTSCYDLDGSLNLKHVDDPAGLAWTTKAVALAKDVITADPASVLYVDDQARRWRLPKGDAVFDAPGALNEQRVCREVCTERDLLNVHGTFYELPAENAGGFARVRPIATHNRRITDYASWRGLLVISGVTARAPASEHIIRSDDGKCALWVGAVDDLWSLGKPRGIGGPWSNTHVKAGDPSDPYLIAGYDRRRVELSHTEATLVKMTLEVDFIGTGEWTHHRTFAVPAGQTLTHEFPAAFGAYWVRLVADADTTATARFVYE